VPRCYRARNYLSNSLRVSCQVLINGVSGMWPAAKKTRVMHLRHRERAIVRQNAPSRGKSNNRSVGNSTGEGRARGWGNSRQAA
jgi:hypothetical protein